MPNTPRPVLCSDGRRFGMIQDAARALGVSTSCIHRAIQKGTTLRQSQLRFSYAEKDAEKDAEKNAEKDAEKAAEKDAEKDAETDIEAWNRLVELVAVSTTRTVMASLRRLQASNSRGGLTETLESILKRQCKVLTTTLRHAKFQKSGEANVPFS